MSRFPKVVVVGQGIAGTAAAWRAAELGAAVTVVAAGAGASTLASGALDHTPWEDLVRAARTTGAEPACGPLDEGVFAFAEALGSWRIPRAGDPMARLATLAGRTRPSRGHDLSLLDLAAIPSGTVAVPRASRAAWDADSLATFWNDDPFVRARGLRFAPIDVALLRYEGEDRIADADLAARHDDPARVAWLAQRLRDAFAREKLAPAAVILGPWLGASAPCAADLTARLGIPAGEALTGAGSPAGLRFARAAGRLLARAQVRVLAARVLAIAPPEGAAETGSLRPGETGSLRPGESGSLRPAESGSLRPGESGGLPVPESGRVPESIRLAGLRAVLKLEGEDPLRADRVVLACGGLTGGGLVYDPPDTHAGADMPPRDNPSFRFSFDVGASGDGRPYLAVGGERAAFPSSMFGPTLDRTAWPSPGQTGSLESIGVAIGADGLAAGYLAAAGDVVEGRPRTALVAVQGALRAASWAAG